MTEDQKQFYREEMRRNLRKLHRMLSAWVVAIASAVAMYWLQLSPEQQQELLSQFPWLIKSAPLLTMVAWVYARVKPQQSITPVPEPSDKKDETRL